MKETKKRGLSTRRRRSVSLGSGSAVDEMADGLDETSAAKCAIEAGVLML